MAVSVQKFKTWLQTLRGEKERRDDTIDVKPLQRRYNILAAVSFVVMMGCVGVPLWWFTTRVYRASLPYSEIENFKYSRVVLPVAVELVAGDDFIDDIFAKDRVKSEVEKKVGGVDFGRMKVALKLTQRKYSAAEKNVLSSPIDSFQSFESELYKTSVGSRGKRKLGAQDVKGDGIEIFVLHRPSEVRIRSHFGTGSRIFVVGNFNEAVRHRLSETLVNVILNGYLRMDELLETVARHTRSESKSINETKGHLSTGILNPKLTLEVHVVDPEPLQCAEQLAAEEIVDDTTVKTFLAAFDSVTKINVKSQMLYKVDFNHEPVSDGMNPPTWFLNPDTLQHLISPIETYLGTDVTTDPVYHVLLYVTPPAMLPLIVPAPERSLPLGHVAYPKGKGKAKRNSDLNVDSTLRSAPYNSFVVSGWGSVTVVNTNRKCTTDQRRLIVDADAWNGAKKALIANVRKFFGLRLPTAGQFERTPTVTLAEWEIQSLRYRALVEYMFSSMRTLESLTKLLGEVSNIVIDDQVAAEIRVAVERMKYVIDAGGESSTNGGSKATTGHWRMHTMLEAATIAFEAAEKAFFDPSLLALLYFPEDQKYAIYIPLFLPVGVPALGSILFIWKNRHLLKL